jgi:hypothetical protein
MRPACLATAAARIVSGAISTDGSSALIVKATRQEDNN